MISYLDLPSHKKAFIFGFDDVLYPLKDYHLQVYWLFAQFLEFTETQPPANDLVAFMKKRYEHHGPQGMFEASAEVFGIDKGYHEHFDRLHLSARLPVKLLLFANMLKLLQDIVIDRGQLFLAIDGEPAEGLNKLKHTEWNELEPYLKVLFNQEFAASGGSTLVDFLIQQHQLKRKDMVIIGRSDAEAALAEANGIDFIESAGFLQ